MPRRGSGIPRGRYRAKRRRGLSPRFFPGGSGGRPREFEYGGGCSSFHFNLGEMELSRKAAQEAVKYGPRDAKAHTFLAYHYFLTRDFSSAKREAGEALTLEPNNFRAAIIVGKSFLANKEFDKALQVFQKMNDVLPDNVEVLYNKGLTLLALGDIWEEAHLKNWSLLKKYARVDDAISIARNRCNCWRHCRVIWKRVSGLGDRWKTGHYSI